MFIFVRVIVESVTVVFESEILFFHSSFFLFFFFQLRLLEEAAMDPVSIILILV